LTDLEIVISVLLSAHSFQLLIVDLLDLSQRLTHLVLPELTVLRGRVAVREGGQLLHLLVVDLLQELDLLLERLAAVLGVDVEESLIVQILDRNNGLIESSLDQWRLQDILFRGANFTYMQKMLGG